MPIDISKSDLDKLIEDKGLQAARDFLLRKLNQFHTSVLNLPDVERETLIERYISVRDRIDSLDPQTARQRVERYRRDVVKAAEAHGMTPVYRNRN